MLRRLQLSKWLGYALIAMIAIAVWQGFNGNLEAIAYKAWDILQHGANIITHLWNSATHGNGSSKK